MQFGPAAKRLLTNMLAARYTSFPSKDYAVKAVQFERRLELAMEGHRFFDLVRYGTAGTVLNAYYDRYRTIMPLKANAHWTAGKNEYFPIPQGEIDNLNSDGYNTPCSESWLLILIKIDLDKQKR